MRRLLLFVTFFSLLWLAPGRAFALSGLMSDCNFGFKSNYKGGEKVCITGELDIVPPFKIFPEAYLYIVPKGANVSQNVYVEHIPAATGGAGAFYDEEAWNNAVGGQWEVLIDQYPFINGGSQENLNTDLRVPFTVAGAPPMDAGSGEGGIMVDGGGPTPPMCKPTMPLTCGGIPAPRAGSGLPGDTLLKAEKEFKDFDKNAQCPNGKKFEGSLKFEAEGNNTAACACEDALSVGVKAEGKLGVCGLLDIKLGGKYAKDLRACRSLECVNNVQWQCTGDSCINQDLGFSIFGGLFFKRSLFDMMKAIPWLAPLAGIGSALESADILKVPVGISLDANLGYKGKSTSGKGTGCGCCASGADSLDASGRLKGSVGLKAEPTLDVWVLEAKATLTGKICGSVGATEVQACDQPKKITPEANVWIGGCVKPEVCLRAGWLSYCYEKEICKGIGIDTNGNVLEGEDSKEACP